MSPPVHLPWRIPSPTPMTLRKRLLYWGRTVTPRYLSKVDRSAAEDGEGNSGRDSKWGESQSKIIITVSLNTITTKDNPSFTTHHTIAMSGIFARQAWASASKLRSTALRAPKAAFTCRVNNIAPRRCFSVSMNRESQFISRSINMLLTHCSPR